MNRIINIVIKGQCSNILISNVNEYLVNPFIVADLSKKNLFKNDQNVKLSETKNFKFL